MAPKRSRRTRQTAQSQDSESIPRVSRTSKRKIALDEDDESSVHSDIQSNSDSDLDGDDDYIQGAQDQESLRNTYLTEQRSRKRRKTVRRSTISGNIDDHEDFEENRIIEALSSVDAPISELAAGWLDQFVAEGREHDVAVTDFVNFVLRSCGCVSKVQPHDVTDSEKANKTIQEVQEMFLRQKYHEFPLYLCRHATVSHWKGFRERALEFINQLLVVASERGILYDNEDFINTLIAWLGSMSTSNESSLRLTATLYSLQLETTLCKLSAAATKFIDRSHRQLRSENNRLKQSATLDRVTRNAGNEEVVQKRIDQIQSNVDLYEKQKKTLDDLATNEVFNVFFAHRYRDVNPDVRLECIKSLGTWMKEYPEVFLKPIYLRYFGWLITDSALPVRRQTLKSLALVYQNPVALSALRQFTSHFKGTLLQMLVVDEPKIKAHAAAVLTEVLKHGFLNDKEVDSIEDSLLHVQREHVNNSDLELILKELARFISAVETDQFNDFIERNGESVKRSQRYNQINLKDLLKLKLLLKELGKASHRSDTDLVNTCKALAQLPRYRMHGDLIQLLLTYLTMDFTELDADDHLKNGLELNDDQKIMALTLLNGACQFLTDARSLKKLANNNRDRIYYAAEVINKLPTLVDLYDKQKDSLTQLLLITSLFLESSLFEEANQIQAAHNVLSSLLRTYLATIPLEPSAKKNPLTVSFDSLISSATTSEFDDCIEDFVASVLKNLGNAIDQDHQEAILDLSAKLNHIFSKAYYVDKISQILPVTDRLCQYLEAHPERLGEPTDDEVIGLFKMIILSTIWQLESDKELGEEQLSTVKKIASLAQILMDNRAIDKWGQFTAVCYFTDIISLIRGAAKLQSQPILQALLEELPSFNEDNLEHIRSFLPDKQADYESHLGRPVSKQITQDVIHVSAVLSSLGDLGLLDEATERAVARQRRLHKQVRDAGEVYTKYMTGLLA